VWLDHSLCWQEQPGVRRRPATSGNPSASWKERTKLPRRVAAELSAIETSGAQEKRPELSRRTGGWRSEAPAGWGCPARLLRSSRPVSSQPHVSRPERQVTPPTPAVTRALADNGTISGSTSAPKTPCHRPGSCATPARAGEQWMRGSGARSSGCCGAAPAHWHCVDLAALDNGGRCRLRVRVAEP
jgi:hypothetical protein